MPEPIEDKSVAADKEVEKPKLKPCCACPETKKARDEWYTNRRGFTFQPIIGLSLAY